MLARSIVAAFTNPGDVVLDPFVGGGTALVESRLLGRRAVGADLNDLAVFVTRAKTAGIGIETVDGLRAMAEAVREMRLRPIVKGILPKGESSLRHLDHPETWRIRNFIQCALQKVNDIGQGETLARCALLRTAQWALDMRSDIPTIESFRSSLAANIEAMAAASHSFGLRVRREDRAGGVRGKKLLVVKEASPGISRNGRVVDFGPPQLILTSPPYPGVYVNYHRWKVRGRLETPAPYWVAGSRDGHGLSHYTMSARADRTLNKYFEQLTTAWQDIANLADERTTFVQIVGFSDPPAQLPRYLAAMKTAGLDEVRIPALATAEDGRLWRNVPGRRWWAVAETRRPTVRHTSSEAVLIHRLH
jgi:hypothetical protein